MSKGQEQVLKMGIAACRDLSDRLYTKQEQDRSDHIELIKDHIRAYDYDQLTDEEKEIVNEFGDHQLAKVVLRNWYDNAEIGRLMKRYFEECL